MKYFFSILLSFLFFSAFSQTSEIRGFLYNKENGEPVIFNSIYLKGTSFGAVTDVNGFYSITQIPAGDYVLFTTALGFDTVEQKISLSKNQKITQNIYLQGSGINMQTVEVNAKNTEKLNEVNVSVTKITPVQIKQLPSVGGEPDLAQYLQVLPGVVFSGDQGGQLYIRGGAPIQNKVLLDGMTIYNPFHSIGLFSVFDTDILRNVDVYSGGYGAEYGGRISAILNVTTRDGNKRRFGGKVSSNPFTSKFLLEGPLAKFQEGKASSSFIFSNRTSYLEQTSTLLYPYADKNGLPFNFNDTYGKVSINSSGGSKLNFFGFNFNDAVNYKAPAALAWNSYGLGSNFVLVPAGSSVLINASFSFSNYKIGLQESTNRPRNSEIGGFNGDLNFTYYLGNDELKYGINLSGYRTDFAFSNASDIKITLNDNTTEFAGYINYRINFKNVILDPGLRLHYYVKQISELSPEPRLGGKILFSENFRFKFASGLFSQNLLAANSDKDVVNLFYGFLSSPDNLPRKFDNEDVSSGLQLAKHLVAGFEVDFLKHFEFNIEAYIKDFNQLININNNQIYPDDITTLNKPDAQKKSFIIERGIAKGVDLTLKYNRKNIYLWAVYSLGFQNRFDGVKTYAPVFDRRHNINLVASVGFGKDNLWRLDGRWNFGSGFPFTQTRGFYENMQFDKGINSDYTQQNGELGIVYGDLNGGRLPYYHRLDISIKKTWMFSETLILEASAGATNIYNRNNIFYYDRINNVRKDQLPILPTLGFNFSF